MGDLGLTIERVASDDLAQGELTAILAMCELAYGEELAGLFATFGPAIHLIGRLDGAIVSHVMWVTRRLQPAGMAPLRTTYVEMVASHPPTRAGATRRS